MSICKKIVFIFTAFTSSIVLAAQSTTPVAQQSSDTIFSNGVFDVMLAIIILLIFVIYGMAEVVNAGAAFQLKIKKDQTKSKLPPAAMIIVLLCISSELFGQEVVTTSIAKEPVFDYWGMGAFTFFTMSGIIFFEILTAFLLFRSGMLMIRVENVKKKSASPEEPSILDKLNDSIAIEHEEAILLDHDYDGIQELDNNLPPWWKYGFYLTIVVSIIYLFNFHILHTGKLSGEEYAQQIKDGEEQVAAYKKSNANLVDESTVTLLIDEASIASGKTIFKQNCVACHGEFGEGKEGLGPNFTDDYWLHGGSVNSIFKSIKYGWTDKGMKSWEQDLKPLEIQEVVSFIKSIRGTNPPNAKEKQGDLYIEEGQQAKTDSTVKTDSTKVIALDSIQK